MKDSTAETLHSISAVLILLALIPLLAGLLAANFIYVLVGFGMGISGLIIVAILRSHYY